MEVPPGYRPIEASRGGLTQGARRVADVNPRETFSVSIRLRRRPDAPSLPDQAYWAATPVGRRRFLSRQEFAARYGAAQEDLDRVAAFARRQGLAIVETSIPRRTLVASGTAQQMGRAFAVELGVYELRKERYRAHPGGIHLPSEVADLVEGVYGLDNRRVLRHLGGTGPKPKGAKGLTPPQVAGLYNFPAWKATGQTIGILEFALPIITTSGPSYLPAGFAESDIQQFMKNLNLSSKVKITVVGVDGVTNSQGGKVGNFWPPDVESTLDVDVALSVAQGAEAAVYFAPNTAQGYIDALTTAIHDAVKAPSVISISFGEAENASGFTSSEISTISATFQEAAALGITVLAASGDDGTNVGINDGSAHVSYPASDPWVLACGGTYTANVIGTSFTQGTWSDPDGATGGGLSVCFVPPPAWQAKANLPASVVAGNPRGRGVPDVAGNASPFSGYDLVLYGTQAINLPTTSKPKPTVGLVGGTSAVAPLYAALIALINADLREPVGYLNPTLYAIAETPGQKVFVDINDGANNAFNFSAPQPPPKPPLKGTAPGYTSGPGWDACTGWGAVDGTQLLNALIRTEETMKINPDNPFNFPTNFPPDWMTGQGGQGSGGTDTYDDLQVGANNTADNNYDGSGGDAGSSPYNATNGGDGNGNDVYGDVTVVNTAVGYNATFAGDNIFRGKGSIGLFGRSRGTDFSIGVMGQSSKGCGIYGMATDEKPNKPLDQPSHGIGVVGRSMGGIAPEEICVEQIMGEPIGVLGHSANGPGVRGHGGPLLTLAQEGPPPAPVVAAPGGVFSSGQLQDIVVGKAEVRQVASLDPLPQLRLVPSTDAKLPARGQIGDLYVCIAAGTKVTANVGASMYLCVLPGDGKKVKARWAPFTLGTPVVGG